MRATIVRIVLVALLLGSATIGAVAQANIQSVSPGSATITAGGQTGATVSVQSTDSCLGAVTVDPSINVSFSPTCSGGGWTSTMTVHTTQLTLPIIHLITITERAGLLGLPVDVAVFTLTVTGATGTTTTTTTNGPTTTAAGTTTTTAAGTTTTTAAGATTTVPSPTTTQPGPGGPGTTAVTTTSTTGATSTTVGSTGTTAVSAAPPNGGDDGGSGPIPFTRSLLAHFEPGAVRTLAAIALSPLAVLEAFVRTIGSTMGSLVLPLALLFALGLWLLVNRRRREARS